MTGAIVNGVLMTLAGTAIVAGYFAFLVAGVVWMRRRLARQLRQRINPGLGARSHPRRRRSF